MAGGVLFPEEKTRLPRFRLFLVHHRNDLPGLRRADFRQKIRRLALAHGLIAFMFNTAILALFVNIAAGLL